METLLRTIAIVLGIIIISTNFFDYQLLVSKLIFKNKKPIVIKEDDGQEFITIVNLWYQLRVLCIEANLKEAVNKIDEVFPLLNDNISMPSPVVETKK